MSLQIQVQKYLSQYDFLSTTPYEINDLTNAIKSNDKIVVRQGDLVVVNYYIWDSRKRGLRGAWSQKKGNIYKFLGSHIVIPEGNQTVLIHPEHGITIIPMPMDSLEFYTFSDAGD